MRNIKQALEEHKAAVLKQYPEDKLLGVFYMEVKTMELVLRILM